MRVRKLTNISDFDITVVLEDGNSIRIPAAGMLENVTVKNFNEISSFVKVEQDLSEVPVVESKTYLKG